MASDSVSLKNRRPSARARRLASLALAFALASQALVATSSAQSSRTNKATLGDEERAVHVLNRLAFGPRPGDVERVRRIGVEAYIEEQLHPERIADQGLEARLKNLPTLRMTNTELLAKYPNPGRLARELQRRGELPADLSRLRDMRAADAPPKNSQTGDGTSGAMTNGAMTSGAMSNEAMPNGATPGGEMTNDERRKYRRAVVRYMREQGMEPPARILPELQAARILRAVYSERQLQEVMVDFWSNHFNVFAGKGADRWFLTSYDRDVIRPNALGRFRDLLEATAKSPAMLFYLDNFQSVSPDTGARRRPLRDLFGAGGGGGRRRAVRRRQRQQTQQSTQGQMQAQQPERQRPRRGINENYARELMELHTLGVEGGYTQKDVQEVARAFTGWTIIAPRGATGGREFLEERAGTFHFNARAHDDGEKTVLGQKIPAGGGIEDGRRVIDILVRHPSTARFIATKLARRFVSDEPPPALVARVASAFSKSDGDIKATLRALFSSPEFNSREARRAKIKTPFELAASALRALGAETTAGPALHGWIARMGEPLYQYQAPTGYPDTAEHWVSTGGLLERLNFALALAANRIPGTRVQLASGGGDKAAASGAGERARLVERFAAQLLQGDLSSKSREVLMKQLGESPGASASADPEAARIAALILGSPEFQRQ
ncbi:MAG TPA: DUF1800 domain-containing protein [Pyrinomonadaceae bacterium]|nr:DUF1800 domain-containing protein [Pyrinomonadaceae bacterium]